MDFFIRDAEKFDEELRNQEMKGIKRKIYLSEDYDEGPIQMSEEDKRVSSFNRNPEEKDVVVLEKKD
jgi:hypothetical protein